MDDGIRVLCVDDEPSLLTLARLFLEKSGGFTVGVAESAREALEAHDILSYDVIVSDYQMPDMDGIEFLKAVRQRFGDIPFILFTGRGREEIVIAAINNGADFYLQKGGDPKAQFAELSHKVRQAVRRKQAEALLKESEEKYRMLVEHSRDGIFIIQDGRLVFYNNALAGLSGYTQEELDGKLLSDLIAPEDREMVLSRARERARGGLVPERYEFSLLHKDGINKSRMLVSTYLGTYHGRPASFGTFYDVTEERRREEALRESEEKYRTILENIQDAYYRTDNDGNLIMLSPSGYRLLGYNPGDNILGSSLARTFYANPGDRRKMLDAISEKGAVQDYEVDFRHRNGTIVTISASSHYYYGPDGRVAGIEGIFRDITEQKRSEENLKRSENLYRTVFENTGTASILIGPDTTILKANAGWERLTGVPRAEQENAMSWTAFIHEGDVARMKEFHYTRRKNPGDAPNVYECRLVDAKGGIHYGFVHVDVIPGTGNSIASLVDVTALKHAQDELKASEERVRTILDHLPDLIVVHREGTILYVNPAMTDSLGWQTEEVVGRAIHDFIAPEYHTSVSDSIRSRLEAGIDTPYSIELIARNGARRVVNVRGTVITFDGSPVIMNVLTDVTTVRNAEIALQESERKYRMLVENTNDVIYTTDISGRITSISPQITRYGYSSDDIVSRNLASFILEEDLPEVLADMEKTLSTGQSTITVFRVRDAAGAIHWLEDNGTAIFDASGNVAGLSGILRDITERKNAEGALRESEERFREMAERSSDLVFILGKEMSPTYVSPSARTIIGYDPEELVGKSPEFAMATIFAKSGPALMDAVRATMDGILVEHVEIPLTRKDGMPVHVHLHAVPVMHDGVLEGAQVSMRDITAEVNAWRALRESEEKFRSFVETSPDMIWETDLKGNFRYISPTISTLMGYTHEEVLGKSITSLIPEEKRSVVMQAFTRYVTSETVFSTLEVPARHRDGHDMIIEIRPARLTDTGGNLIGLRGVAVDVTERKKALDALRHANRQLNLLGGITRHDILNKVSVILGYLEIARDDIRDPRVPEYMKKIESATRDIRSQIEFMRMYRDIGTREPAWIAPDAILPRMHVPAGISFHADIGGVEIFADPMVERVFYNLLDNTVRHGERVTEITVSAHHSGDTLVIVWEDNGVGIPASEKERIFERGVGKNTGLGMFLARDILSLTGISIKETGEHGLGARFEIMVPAGRFRVSAEQG